MSDRRLSPGCVINSWIWENMKIVPPCSPYRKLDPIYNLEFYYFRREVVGLHFVKMLIGNFLRTKKKNGCHKKN